MFLSKRNKNAFKFNINKQINSQLREEIQRKIRNINIQKQNQANYFDMLKGNFFKFCVQQKSNKLKKLLYNVRFFVFYILPVKLRSFL